MPPPGNPVDVTMQLTQSQAADGHGLFPVASTFTFVGTPCFSSGTSATVPFGSTIAGTHADISMSTNEQPSASQAIFGGDLDISASPNVINGRVAVLSGACAGQLWLGTLSKL